MDYTRDYFTNLVGYATGKSAQLFLMMALARHNDRGATVTALSPHFDLEDIEFYYRALDRAYDHITNMDPAQNGRIKWFPGPQG
jgi:hypothetical protein